MSISPALLFRDHKGYAYPQLGTAHTQAGVIGYSVESYREG